ncbi:MAG TPA: ATP synthase F1 subunit epsilon [Thermoanaerobaculia bacterium]|jgi:F-type H+-transporting ATPase subunit epsilon|nr:ATP synthase F1 subunit epsilon [Thermoanaerobaculia bacterium]
MADPLPTKLRLTIVTRERKIVETDVDEVELPASDGEIGILPGHTPLLASLKVGQMKYRTGTTTMRLVITWGFAEVLPDRVIVMAETARLPQEVDLATAEAERAEAERALADLSSQDPEFAVVEARLEESIAMIDLHRGM